MTNYPATDIIATMNTETTIISNTHARNDFVDALSYCIQYLVNSLHNFFIFSILLSTMYYMLVLFEHY